MKRVNIRIKDKEAILDCLRESRIANASSHFFDRVQLPVLDAIYMEIAIVLVLDLTERI